MVPSLCLTPHNGVLMPVAMKWWLDFKSKGLLSKMSLIEKAPHKCTFHEQRNRDRQEAETANKPISHEIGQKDSGFRE